MRRLTAVLFASLALVACGDDGGGDEARETITAGETPDDLRNLWESNMDPDTELVVVETEAGPMFVHEDDRFSFGTCDAKDALEETDPMMAYVCNP